MSHGSSDSGKYGHTTFFSHLILVPVSCGIYKACMHIPLYVPAPDLLMMSLSYLLLSCLVGLAASANADCSTLGEGASDSFSGSFQLAAYNPATGTTTALHLINYLTVPETGFHLLSVCIPPLLG